MDLKKKAQQVAKDIEALDKQTENTAKTYAEVIFYNFFGINLF